MKQLKVFCTIALVIVAMAMPLVCVSASYAEATHPEVTAESAAEAHGGHDIGTELPLWSVLPFAGILLSIALFPLFAPHFWHHHFPKVSAFWALVFAIPFVIYYKGVATHEILHIYIIDYIPFIIDRKSVV